MIIGARARAMRVRCVCDACAMRKCEGGECRRRTHRTQDRAGRGRRHAGTDNNTDTHAGADTRRRREENDGEGGATLARSDALVRHTVHDSWFTPGKLEEGVRRQGAVSRRACRCGCAPWEERRRHHKPRAQDLFVSLARMSSSLQMFAEASAGAVAGFFSSFCVYPIEVVKTRPSKGPKTQSGRWGSSK